MKLNHKQYNVIRGLKSAFSDLDYSDVLKILMKKYDFSEAELREIFNELEPKTKRATNNDCVHPNENWIGAGDYPAGKWWWECGICGKKV